MKYRGQHELVVTFLKTETPFPEMDPRGRFLEKAPEIDWGAFMGAA